MGKGKNGEKKSDQTFLCTCVNIAKQVSPFCKSAIHNFKSNLKRRKIRRMRLREQGEGGREGNRKY